MDLGKRFTKMAKITTIGIILLGAILAVAACSGQGATKLVKATWVKPRVAGDTVSILVSEVKNNKMVHFYVADALGSEIAFMAYEMDGKLYVRANVCPPCRSVGFSLFKDTLVCDSCRTTFKAKTGDGIAGACVAYPKASVPYEISDGKVVMRGNDLLVADKNTKEPGWP